MNSRPMILRLVSGSVTPASASRKRSLSSATTRRTPVAATKSRSTCSASPARSSPWSTNTQVSWSPTAFCTIAAATAESTPPDSPQITCAAPTWARMRSTCSSMTLALVQSGVRPATEYRKFSSAACPSGVCLTSGCHCTPAMRRAVSSNAATGAPSVEASTVKPSGACVHRVAVAHPHRLLGGAARQGGPGVGDARRGAAVLAQARLGDGAAKRLGHELEAVADAEDGHAGVVDRRRRPVGRRPRTPRRGRRTG